MAVFAANSSPASPTQRPSRFVLGAAAVVAVGSVVVGSSTVDEVSLPPPEAVVVVSSPELPPQPTSRIATPAATVPATKRGVRVVFI